MASLGDVGDVLRRVLDRIDQSIAAHHRAADFAEEARAFLADAGSGTVQADVEQVCALFARVVEEITEPEGQVSGLATAADMIRSYLRVIGVEGAEVSAGIAASEPAHHVESFTGDRYPPAADYAAPMLPGRVVPGADQRTVGIARIGGRQLPPMNSGWDPVWSAAVQRRAAELDVNGDFLAVHVEMKIAAMMIDTRTSCAELTINYTPCGVEQLRWRPDVCHKVLEFFLPAGYSLTVYGTTQDNQPFAHAYRGRG